MKLGIMQPYFFPYLGYFELIERTDRWVVFDVVQYSARSWMNRNRILHPSQSWQYFNVPVQRASRGTLIKDIHVISMEDSLSRIISQLQHYKKRAPYFDQVVALVEESFSRANSDRLVDLNVSTIATICSYLGISFNWSHCSEMNLNLDDIQHPGQWALKISTQLGANEYLNPPGGRDIFVSTEWDEAGIDLQFTDLLTYHYDCKPYEFIEHLSILDVLMWNEPESVMTVLRQKATSFEAG